MNYKNNKKLVIALAAVMSVASASQVMGFASNSHSDSGPSHTTKQIRIKRAPARPAKTVATPAPVRAARTDNVAQIGNPRAGECYAQVIIPAQYRTVTEKVQVQEASSRIEIIPAEYGQSQVKVQVRGPSRTLEVVPAQYKTVKEKILVTPESSRIIQVPAEYGYVEEKVLVNPARTVWKKGVNPYGEVDLTGDIVCLVELPAEYQTVRKKVVKKPATTRTEIIPATYEWVEKTVEAKPATTRSVEIPAEYATKSVQTLVKPEQKRVIPIPAEFSTVTRQVKVSESKTEWRRILCETNTTAEVLYNIQKTLKAKGFNPGPIDGTFSAQTKMALENYQQSKSLPKGYLNYETLRSLGIRI